MKINKDSLFEETCKYRKFTMTKKDAIELLSVIETNEQIQLRWRTYSKRNKYANVDLKDAIKAIRYWIDKAYV